MPPTDRPSCITHWTEIEKPDDAIFILGQKHFIKSVDAVYEKVRYLRDKPYSAFVH